ncbi:MAG: 4Fe-4S binding protein [Deltaproteobacteria bacterium]|nr:4Fe-4S binding protein [Deltaproteobacteria bacterium]MBW1736517.1 4Fe-4S binding protein [Deltaproteobacteria bacterium]MBW1908651.1 4Fe-4S binding protein [Deltaproteobacteria bacterium]MBW2033394.1 4Fe-4S binding protein [Deltaproteobacteria bacterium]MBW2113940.1 4Fe-4S binding protein [Deltaproteobacteria bacterium]
MEESDIYGRLAHHLSFLGMGYPPTEDLVEILRENFSPTEAEVALAIPTRVIPLQPVMVDEIIGRVNLTRPELVAVLDDLSMRGLLFSSKTEDGEKGYALQQVGFSFPQTFFWKGEDTAHARNMADLVAKYFNRKVTQEAYSSETNAYRYIPVSGTIEPDFQSVYPHHSMESVIEKAKDFAVCHCSCRMIARLRGRPCEHPTEVCIKFDEVAQYVIDRKLGRAISREEAREIIKQSEEEGLVHFVDNAVGDIKHNCNCCGCACWNVGALKRRKIPRDAIMATYFIRETDLDECTGCGECSEICPVDAVRMEDDIPVVDMDWCIGCGVCVSRCPTEAAKIRLRPDKMGELPATNFAELHQVILREKGLK